jgi:cytochrome c peroxidase
VLRTHYARAGRAVHAGRAANPLRSEFIAGFQISEAEIADVVAFLESLTDERFLSEPRHRSPWPPAAASAPTFQQPTKIRP